VDTYKAKKVLSRRLKFGSGQFDKTYISKFICLFLKDVKSNTLLFSEEFTRVNLLTNLTTVVAHLGSVLVNWRAHHVPNLEGLRERHVTKDPTLLEDFVIDLASML